MKLKFKGNPNNTHEYLVAKLWNVEGSLGITFEEVQAWMFPQIGCIPDFCLEFLEKGYSLYMDFYGTQKFHWPKWTVK